MIDPRFQNLVGTAKITATSDDGQLQRAQVRVSNLEMLDNVGHLATYGLASRPMAGADALILSLGGNRTNSLVIGTHDERHRVRNLAEGETAIYKAAGMRITLSNSGIIIEGGGSNVTINNAPQIVVNGGDVVVNGGDVIADGVSLRNHRHGGVESGGSQTTPPV